MLILNATVTRFKSIEDCGSVTIEPDVTTLVGQNEAGKTAFLRALEPASPAIETVKYDATRDYPRKDYARHKRDEKVGDSIVAKIEYQLSAEQEKAINNELGVQVLKNFKFTRSSKYSRSWNIFLNLDPGEGKLVSHLVQGLSVDAALKAELTKKKTIDALIDTLENMEKDDVVTEQHESLDKRFPPNPNNSSWGRLNWWLWSKHLKDTLPRFLYFDEYRVLPAKTNLNQLKKRIANSQTTNQDDAVLRLLELAGVTVDGLLDPDGYEEATAELESISADISDQVFKYWRQNKQLEVLFDVKEDPKDDPPFNTGKNLYVRIKNTRHKVTVPFDQRSKGFIWFFSFLVWFDSMQEEVDEGVPLVLLLDEPGLNLHALAQADFLQYIEDKSEEHQIIYTTHSPFMVDSGKLHRVRTVEDHPSKGTLISDDLSGSSDDTLFPLQAALGYTIAQNLFIGKKNLLVEGISDFVLLQTYSDLLEQLGRTSLSDGITLTPTGGIKKIPTFISLLGANDLDIVVLHDYEGENDQQLQKMIENQLIDAKSVLSYADFRGDTPEATDVEDLIDSDFYIERFNQVYRDQVGKDLSLADLPEGPRLVDRISRYLKDAGIKLRKKGGYNHHRVAKSIASAPPDANDVDADTLDRFEAVFAKVNKLLK